ncbi:hypothetical protein GCM10010420_30540 [Streptomyces glaucosporus]|uniref:Secreted protein n=1 Tax=Streptomyces glaucosporus TaxID=284044 RepID=A0ABP5VIN6_9ACTN
MNLLNRAFGSWPRRAAVLTAAVALGVSLAPLAGAEPGAGARPEAAVSDEPDLLLETPASPRISDDPYAPFQFCGNPAGDPVVASGTPSLAATLESVAPPGSVEKPGAQNPGHRVVFEVSDADGKAVLHKNLVSQASHTAVFQIPDDKRLTDGGYRWRVRVQDQAAASAWTDWCDFTVRTEAPAS